MKVVVNRCFGGFGLSPKAMIEIAKRKGIEIYPYLVTYEFDNNQNSNTYTRLSDSIDIPNDKIALIDFFLEDPKNDSWTTKWRESSPFDSLKKWNPALDYEENRADEDLVAVVEELGSDAEGDFAELKVIEIDDGLNFFIQEYDGMETLVAGNNLQRY